ncbi:MAG: anaerobic ribonucleoside-triphosphate reductase activating protein [Atopobiaceae bacterium]|nr:anaerobic ribonucleoside-triphosphate reductase activating protein [Atopobiaceae bacterium]
MTDDPIAVGLPSSGGDALFIGGIIPFSTVDWPGKIACVAFLAGCPWRCPYCQNHILQTFDSAQKDAAARGSSLGTAEDLFGFLSTRRGLLDGVVFSGGEPLVQPGVIGAARRAKEMGFEVGLHTCGAFPARLREVLPYVDWVGLDVKAPWEKYDAITLARTAGSRDSGALALESLEAILEAGVPMEARTTWHPSLLTPDDIAAIGRDLAARGVPSWAVQAYRHTGTDGSLPDETVYPSDMPAGIAELFESFEFRRA